MSARFRYKLAGTVCVVAAGVVTWLTISEAAIIGTRGRAQLLPPADVRDNMTVDDTRIRAMNERQCFDTTGLALPSVDRGMVEKGVKISCHLLHYDPVNPPQTVTGRVRFDGDILALVDSSPLLDAWDSICDDGSGAMTYPGPGDELYRGLEPTVTPNDQAVVIGPRTVEMTAEVTDYSDQVRVITCCDDECMIPDGVAGD